MADVARRRRDGAVLNAAVLRVCGGVLVLAVYGAVLLPARGSADAAPAAERWLTQSREAYAAGRFAEALEPTLALTDAFPNQQVYVERLALIYQRLDRRSDEARAWERFVNLSPTPVAACPALPDAYVASGEASRALDAFERCSEYEPGNAEMLFYLGRFHERAGRSDHAAAAYRKAVDLDPSAADNRLGLARLDLKAGRLAEAERGARLVLASNQDNADALLVAGLAAQRQGRGVEARRDLVRALVVAEHYVDVHIALGILDFGEGHVADASRHFRRAVDLDPARRAELAVWLERVGGRP